MAKKPRSGLRRTKDGNLRITREMADQFIADIEGKESKHLLRVWRECVPVGTEEPDSHAARLMREIESRWDKSVFDSDDWFSWPNAEGFPGGGDMGAIAWRDRGLLKLLGYSVDQEAEPARVRKALLSAIFNAKLPRLADQNYMNEWGSPASAARLRKMANSLAAFARNADRKGSSYAHAAARWRDDLSHLYDTFYVGRFGFGWPSGRSSDSSH